MNKSSFFLRLLPLCAALICGASCGIFVGAEIPLEGNAAPRGRGTVARLARVRTAGAGAAPDEAGQNAAAGLSAGQNSAGPGASGQGAALPDLERIAEIERSGLYFPGLALTESALREKAGNYTGAALAAYKELSRAYSYGTADTEQVKEGLQNAITLIAGAAHVPDRERDSARAALEGCLAFSREDWNRAEKLLSGILRADEEPDSFLRWMLLVCALEKESGQGGSREASLSARSAYGAIRARYTFFPEYWYRGARAFSSQSLSGKRDGAPDDGNISAAFAEQCINSGPAGPFAEDSRRILASHFGFSSGGKKHSTIRTKAEIEEVIRGSVSANNPLLLEDLFPLMDLPENPYTLYAMNALKALSSLPEFKTFFAEAALGSSGRLGERLNYISRS